METAYIAANQRTLLSRLLESERQIYCGAAACWPEPCDHSCCARQMDLEVRATGFVDRRAPWERHTRQIEAVKGSAAYRAANRQRTAS